MRENKLSVRWGSLVAGFSIVLHSLTSHSFNLQQSGDVRDQHYRPGPAKNILAESKMRLESTIVKVGLAVSFSNISCGDQIPNVCEDLLQNQNPSVALSRASLNVFEWAESMEEIDRALSELEASEKSKSAFRISAIQIRNSVGKMQQQIDLNPQPIIPESLAGLSRSRGINALEIHYHVVLFRDRILLFTTLVDRTARDLRAHRAILKLPGTLIQIEPGKGLEEEVRESTIDALKQSALALAPQGKSLGN